MKIISASEDVHGECRLEKDTRTRLVVQFNMLRVGEYIRFQALAEVYDGDKNESVVKRLIDSIKVNYRIADLPSIKHIRFEEPNPSRVREIFITLLMVLGVFLLSTVAVLFSPFREVITGGHGIILTTPKVVIVTTFFLALILALILYIKARLTLRSAQKLSGLMTIHADDDSSHTDQTPTSNQEKFQSNKSVE